MANQPLIHSAEPNQHTSEMERLARQVSEFLTEGENILYIAKQNFMALSLFPNCVVATNNRIILFDPQIFGRAKMDDYLWQMVGDSKTEQGILSSLFTIQTKGENPRLLSMQWLRKDQTRHLYAIAQDMEQIWLERDRVRKMDEERARSGGFYAGGGSGSPGGGQTQSAAELEERLRTAKRMLDEGTIGQSQYEQVVAQIMSRF